MTTNQTEQPVERPSESAGIGGATLISLLVAVATGLVWAWWYSTEFRFNPTPVWAYVLFYGMLTAVPLLVGLIVRRWPSALAAPAGLAAGLGVAWMLVESADDLTGEFDPLMALAVQSAIMIVAWLAGRSIRWAATRR